MDKDNNPDSSYQAYKDTFRLSAESSSMHREKIPKRTTLEIILGKTFGVKGWVLYAIIAITYIYFSNKG
ncbi:MAG: hypothetical protein DRQ78_08820 [Epsilonproteobacteria bacterium]|nr:MAG: hypothetical protein DRQ78_08820 [Campylobacterota bacterium]